MDDIKPPLNIVARVEIKTGNMLLCWIDSANGRYINAIGIYDTVERAHSQCSLAWYRANTTAPLSFEHRAESRKLYQQYTENWEGQSTPRLRKNLRS